MARYIPFVSPSMINLITDEFKQVFMTQGPSPLRQALANLKDHSTEGVPTIVMNLRESKNKLESDDPKYPVKTYDLNNSLNLKILE